MDFQNVNPLNVWLNVLTGNLLPMVGHDSPISFFWRMYSVFVWILEIAVTIMMIPGCMYVSMEKAIKDSLICFEKNLFYYEDYRVPAGFSKQPFPLKVFLSGGLFILLGMVYSFIKKVSAEVYTVHLILMITAQYRYIAEKIAMIFQEENEDGYQKGYLSTSYRKKETEIKALCQYHNEVIYLMSMLKELLSLTFTVMYINNVLRFCFIGVLLSNLAEVTFFEAMSIIIYTSGALAQLYILCSCVQQLINASTEISDKAFHEKWYLLQPSIKHVFILIIMANHLECKIATFKNFNFSLPSFMAILNQSYSIALLFLKTN
ncbi:PREDICTED: putative odorant receptor 92a [Atta colombica]|uniref:putative odorant receptor 92a n=1 Tax=Atta colombica TaxID=520822 RepID=UPI00084BCB31|nr:PREDICTED: putative odorant receptor 92a [Atta colombica]